MVEPARSLVMSPRSSPTTPRVARVGVAGEGGVAANWRGPQPGAPAALVTAAALLTSSPTVRVGTVVLPVLARHPVALAQASATPAEMSDGRFRLSLGISHRLVNQFVLGLRDSSLAGP